MNDADWHGLGPAYAIRLGDLREWHYVELQCFACRRVERLGADKLRRLVVARGPRLGSLQHRGNMVDHERLVTIERRLACKVCGNREMNTLAVRKIDRNA